MRPKRLGTRLLLFALSATLLWSNGPNTHAEDAFIDVPQNHRYLRSITALKEEGSVQGYPIGTFLPDNPINRAEALKLIVMNFPLETPIATQDIAFTDVGTDAWYLPHLKEAVTRGIARGYDDNTFRPEATLNRAEAIKMTVEARNTGTAFETFNLIENPATDVNATDWFAPYFVFARNNSMVYKNAEGGYDPTENVTRGELVDLIFRLKNPTLYSAEVAYGKATYYAGRFQGDHTASGAVFNQGQFTAAHLTLPFGTRVRVTNPHTKATVEVIINDRGPYHPKAILDLSTSAFEQIGRLSAGLVDIEMEVINNE